MECPMCWELYQEKEKTALNLLCGHTYCQICLEKISQTKRRIECPLCRHKHDPSIKVSSLSKNYVAMELASKHLEVAKKLQLCPSHTRNPLQFFCEDCQLHLCTDCIVEHSGHKFCKQEHSVSLLRERLDCMRDKLKSNLDQQESLSRDFESAKSKLNGDFQSQMEVLDKAFDDLISRIEDRRKSLKAQYSKAYEEEIKFIEQDSTTNQTVLTNLNNINIKMNTIRSQLDALQVLKDDKMIKLVDNLNDELGKDLKTQSQLKVNEYRQIPKLCFDNQVKNEILKFGSIAESYSHPKLCFFGDKHKILIYDMVKEQWQYKQLPQQQSSLEFNYYSASTTLPSGEIIITGGGVSRNVILVSPQKNFTCQNLKNMYFPRKEHATVYLNGYVYAIGGYDGSQKQMLSSCERFSLETQEWKVIEPLQKAKCAFAASAVNNEYIFVFGGFDGRERLNTIERYSAKDNKWTTMETKFKNGFSNAASVSPQENKLLILGGGSNQGFTLDLQIFDMGNNTLKVLIQSYQKNLTKMSEGRDLRNKLSYVNGFLYACGGNNCSAEKYSLASNQWVSLNNYNSFVSDNLDSWCCALTFDPPENAKTPLLSQQVQNKPQQNPNNYQIYEYFSDGLSEELVEDEDYPEYDQGQSEDLDDLHFRIHQRGRNFPL